MPQKSGLSLLTNSRKLLAATPHGGAGMTTHPLGGRPQHIWLLLNNLPPPRDLSLFYRSSLLGPFLETLGTQLFPFSNRVVFLLSLGRAGPGRAAPCRAPVGGAKPLRVVCGHLLRPAHPRGRAGGAHQGPLGEAGRRGQRVSDNATFTFYLSPFFDAALFFAPFFVNSNICPPAANSSDGETWCSK